MSETLTLAPSGPPAEPLEGVREVGIIMNGVSGRMGYRQHLVRSILAIRDAGGIELADGSRLTVRPLLVGRSEAKLAEIAAQPEHKPFADAVRDYVQAFDLSGYDAFLKGFAEQRSDRRD